MIKELFFIASILQVTQINIRDWGMAGQYKTTSLQNTSILISGNTLLKIKKGVNITGIKPEMNIAIIAAMQFCTDIEKDCVITCALDGQHMKSSLHYVGYAVDFRIRHMNKTERKMFKVAMKDALVDNFDVILESSHLHVEYQPER